MNVDIEVIATRLARLAEHLSDLSALKPITLDEYQSNKILRGYVERTLQVCIQICLDVGNHLIAEFGFRHPERNRDIFIILHEEGIIPTSLLPDLIEMAGFRNIVVHDYTRVDNVIVYEILNHHLEDFSRFARAVTDYLDI